jgi:hypothetical protein
MAKNTCPVCCRPLSVPTVRLWDGRRYCRACVDATCPGLASFAAENPVLELVLPRIKFWRTYLSLLLFMNAGIAAWFGIPMAWFSVVDLNGERVPPGDALAAVAISWRPDCRLNVCRDLDRADWRDRAGTSSLRQGFIGTPRDPSGRRRRASWSVVTSKKRPQVFNRIASRVR